MTRKRVNKDVVERRYLQLKLARDKRKISLSVVRAYITALQEWLRGSPKRTKKAGGLGR